MKASRKNLIRSYDVCIVASAPVQREYRGKMVATLLVERIKCGNNKGMAQQKLARAIEDGFPMSWICGNQSWSRTSTKVDGAGLDAKRTRSADRKVESEQGAAPERLAQLASFYAGVLDRDGYTDPNGYRQYPDNLPEDSAHTPFPMVEILD